MKKEDMYNGMTGIRSEYLDEADAYKAPKKIHWKRWIAAAACFCLLAVGSLSLFPRENAVPSFAITAYAMETDGSTVWHEMKLDEKIKLVYTDSIEHAAGRNISGYYFDLSQPDMDTNDYFVAFSVTDENGRILPTNEETLGLHGEKCRWFATPGNDIADVSLYDCDDDLNPVSDLTETAQGPIEPHMLGKLTVWQPNNENNVYCMVAYYTSDYKLAVRYYLQMIQEDDGYYAELIEEYREQ